MGALLLLLPVMVGAGVMFGAGASSSRYLVQVVVGAVGALLSLAIARSPKLPARAGLGLAAVAVLALAAPLVVGADIDGVRRWVELGAYRVHPSMLVCPLILVFSAGALDRHPWWGHASLVTAQVVHALGPDRGQATALGLAAIALTLVGDRGRRRALVPLYLVPLYAASIAVAWLRADPLGPAPFVEDIVARAFALSPIVGSTAVLACAASVCAPIVGSGAHTVGDPHGASGSGERAAALALVAYFAAGLLVPLVGQFPVPLLGFGASPALGAFLGLAVLDRRRRLARRERDASATTSAPPSNEDDAGTRGVGRAVMAAGA